MDVRVLGCSGTYPAAHCPCSGYLVTGSDARVWIDAGTGTFAALQQVADFRKIDAVVLSHVHGDHCLDLLPFYYALRLDPEAPRKLPVYAPAGSKDCFIPFLAGDFTDVFSQVFDFRLLNAGDRIEVGDIALDFAETVHPVPTLAIGIEADGHRMVYSADTGPSAEVERFARGADSFVCEASWPAGHCGPPLHLTSTEAGRLAARAGVGALFLTHVYPTVDHRASRIDASDAFGDEVACLEAGMVLRADGTKCEPV